MSGEEKLEKRLEQLGQAMGRGKSMVEDVMGRIERLGAEAASTKRVGSHTKIWRNIMNGRFIKYAAAAVVVIGVVGLLTWLAGGNGTASITFAQVIEPIRQAQSLSYTETTQVEGRNAGVVHYMQLEPGLTRRSVEGGRITITDWRNWPNDFRMLSLDPATKTARIIKSTAGLARGASTPVRSIIEEVKDFEIGEETDLGTKQINGHKAVGFRLSYGRRDYDVWADARTGAPVRIECEYPLRDGRKVQITITDIEIDIELDEQLFSFEPEGYTIN